ncbi:MAG TPA: hypothetical protein VGB95_00550 [Chitinophagales bacterium]
MKKSLGIVVVSVVMGLVFGLSSCSKYPTVSQRRTESFQFTHYDKH